ncbi:MAG: hypothetical protein WBZ33_06375 [Thermoactinomyces sp.]
MKINNKLKKAETVSHWLESSISLTDENQTKKGDGRYSLFQGGAIYWYPERGAFVVYGPVLEKWRTTGAETGILGYPISDVSGPVTNQFAHFQKGTIRCNREQCKVEMNQ